MVLVLVSKIVSYLVENREDMIDSGLDKVEQMCYNEDDTVKKDYEWVLTACTIIREAVNVPDDDESNTSPV